MFISYSLCVFQKGKTHTGVGKEKGDGVEKVDNPVESKIDVGVGKEKGDGGEKTDDPDTSKTFLGFAKKKDDEGEKMDYPVIPKVQGFKLPEVSFVIGLI